VQEGWIDFDLTRRTTGEDGPGGAALGGHCPEGQAGGGPQSEGVLPTRNHAPAHRRCGVGFVTTYLCDLDGLPLLIDDTCMPLLDSYGIEAQAQDVCHLMAVAAVCTAVIHASFAHIHSIGPRQSESQESVAPRANISITG